MDDYHGSRGCPIHKQVKEVMAYNVKHNMRMEEAMQPSEEDVPMLAIGRLSLWSNDRNVSYISEGPLELGLDQNDTLPLGTETTDQHARENESHSPSHKYARLSNEAASTVPDDQDRFLAKVKAAEPKKCTTPTPLGREVTAIHT